MMAQNSNLCSIYDEYTQLKNSMKEFSLCLSVSQGETYKCTGSESVEHTTSLEIHKHPKRNHEIRSEKRDVVKQRAEKSDRIANEYNLKIQSQIDFPDSRITAAESQSELVFIFIEFLQVFIQKSDSLSSGVQTSFHGIDPTFTISYYVKRIAKYSGASPANLVVSLLYLKRIVHRRRNLRLTSNTIQRLLLVAIMIAAKYLDDRVCSNTCWAQIGGLRLAELNALELEFLFAIDFDLSVHPEDYTRCIAALLANHAAGQDYVLSVPETYRSDESCVAFNVDRDDKLKVAARKLQEETVGMGAARRPIGKPDDPAPQGPVCPPLLC